MPEEEKKPQDTPQSTEDALQAVVEEQAKEQIPAAETIPEPKYLTQEDFQAHLRQMEESISRRWQSLSDRRIADVERKAEARIAALRTELSQKELDSEEREVMALPEDERVSRLADLAYRRVKRLEGQGPREPAGNAAEQQTERASQQLIAEVQRRAQAEFPGLFYDIRLWQGTDAGQSVENNLRVIRENALSIAAAPSTSKEKDVRPASPARQPETIPIRVSPAAPVTMKDDEIQDWIIREPGNQKAQAAYRQMRQRWTAGS